MYSISVPERPLSATPDGASKWIIYFTNYCYLDLGRMLLDDIKLGHFSTEKDEIKRLLKWTVRGKWQEMDNNCVIW